MNTSTTEQSAIAPKGGALADGLTLLRALIAPIIALVIIFGWPATGFAILASVLFALGALTDLFDDMIGGPKKSTTRLFGWFDDIADSILIGAALIAMMIVMQRGGVNSWTYTLPVIIYISRDIVVGLVKGYEFKKFGLPKSRLNDIKSSLAMLGISLMIGSPWLQQVFDRLIIGSDGERLINAYNNSAPWVWVIGHIIFCIATLLTILTAIGFLRNKPVAQDSTI